MTTSRRRQHNWVDTPRKVYITSMTADLNLSCSGYSLYSSQKQTWSALNNNITFSGYSSSSYHSWSGNNVTINRSFTSTPWSNYPIMELYIHYSWTGNVKFSDGTSYSGELEDIKISDPDAVLAVVLKAMCI